MSKSELIEKVAEKTGLKKTDSAACVNATLSVITEALSKHESVVFIGFGSFSVKNRQARTGRDPKSGKEIQIEAKNVVKFKPGASLKLSVN